MLDEAAIADPTKYDVKDLEYLYIRRTKTSAEVRESLKGTWADRGPSQPVPVLAGEKEPAVFREPATRWIPADPAQPSVSPQQLVPYQLLKSFLSSHRALLETIGTRLTTLDRTGGRAGTGNALRQTERAALEELKDLAEQIRDEDSAKLTALLACGGQ
jgi:hypothetical protein